LRELVVGQVPFDDEYHHVLIQMPKQNRGADRDVTWRLREREARAVHNVKRRVARDGAPRKRILASWPAIRMIRANQLIENKIDMISQAE
jgi:hypothetical protein